MDQNWVLTFDVTLVKKAFQEKFNESKLQLFVKKWNSALQLHNNYVE